MATTADQSAEESQPLIAGEEHDEDGQNPQEATSSVAPRPSLIGIQSGGGGGDANVLMKKPP